MGLVIKLFDAREISVMMSAEHRPMVSVREVCSLLNLDYPAQRVRIIRDKKYTWVNLGKKPMNILCIPVTQLDGFLFQINADHVSPEFQNKLRAYQRTCFQVLSSEFHT